MTIIAMAPRAAPADTPISCGSASGLRNSPCSEAPAMASEAPTVAASAMRGTRNSVSTVR